MVHTSGPLVTHWCDNTARAVTDVRPEDSRTTFHALPYEKHRVLKVYYQGVYSMSSILASMRLKDVLPSCRRTAQSVFLGRLCFLELCGSASVMLFLANLLQALVLVNGLRSSHCQRAFLGEYSPRVTLRHPHGRLWESGIHLAYSCILHWAACGAHPGATVGHTRTDLRSAPRSHTWVTSALRPSGVRPITPVGARPWLVRWSSGPGAMCTRLDAR